MRPNTAQQPVLAGTVSARLNVSQPVPVAVLVALATEPGPRRAFAGQAAG